MKILFFLVFLSLTGISAGQQLIRFSGVVVDNEKYQPVAGTAILNQSSGGGTVSDSLGFFSVKAKPGDTLLFKDSRYLSSVLVIPEVLDQEDYGIIQQMSVDTRLSDEVQIYSFPTEEEFKEAFMEANPVPDLEDRALEARRSLMQTIKETFDNDVYYYNMWADRRLYQLTGDVPKNNFLNPLRWVEFVNRHLAPDEED